jgi:retron-type reverse transcriptase
MTFFPKPLLILERFRFHKWNQEEGESIVQYVAVLKSERERFYFWHHTPRVLTFSL